MDIDTKVVMKNLEDARKNLNKNAPLTGYILDTLIDYLKCEECYLTLKKRIEK